MTLCQPRPNFSHKRFTKTHQWRVVAQLECLKRLTHRNDKMVSFLSLTFKEVLTKVKGVANQLPTAQLVIIISYSSNAYYTAQAVIQIVSLYRSQQVKSYYHGLKRAQLNLPKITQRAQEPQSLKRINKSQMNRRVP